MYNPKLYYKANGLQRRDATEVLNEYIHLMKWERIGGDFVLDIGSGSGDITWDLLLPRLPNNFKKLIGVDISDAMVKYARSQYIHPNIQFDTLDISASELPLGYREKFHHVFSFYCLHWIQEQRQTMKNIYDLLQPGGDMLVTFLASNPIYDIYLTMAKMDKWKPYLVDLNKYISPYHHVEDVEETLRTILKSIGFQVQICQCKNKIYEFEDLNTLQKAMIAVNPFLSNFSDNLKQQFIIDYTNEARRMKFFEESNNNKSERIVMPYKLIVICANKPS